LTDNQLAHEFGKGVLSATIKLLSIATLVKTSKIHKSADGNINTPHGGKTAVAAESEEDDGSSKLIAKES
jgi:hypothetical protein